MKLSQMTTDQMADCLLEISSAISNIAEDARVADVITEFGGMRKKDSTVTVQQALGMAAKRLIPLALKEHRQDAYAILAALTGKKPSQIGAQNALATIKEARESIDQELIRFFT